MREAYKTDLTDAQWEEVKGLLPPAKPGGRPRKVDLREVVNTLMYQARTSRQWDMLPHDLQAKSTVHDYFEAWRDDGTMQKIVDVLRGKIRMAEGREETPSAACIDSQTVKSTEAGGPRGFDGGKMTKGRKRHIITDTLGLLIVVAVTAANLDDGTHASEALGKLKLDELPRLTKVFADKKYNNNTLRDWMAENKVPYELEISVKPEEVKGFKPLKIRWVVEQSHACLGRCRRLSKDYERTTASSEAWVMLAAIQRMARRLHPDLRNPQPAFKYRQAAQAA